jgi:hypothetical protein
VNGIHLDSVTDLVCPQCSTLNVEGLMLDGEGWQWLTALVAAGHQANS